jgi:hypothetical protein
MNKDINIIIFQYLTLPEQFNFYKYCKKNHMNEETRLIEKKLKYLDQLSEDEWSNLLVEYQYELDEEFLDMFKHKIDWYMVCVYQTLSEEYIFNNKANLCWRPILLHQNLTFTLIDMFMNEIDWEIFSSGRILPEEIIEYYEDKLLWDYLVIKDPSETFLLRYCDKINWLNVRFSNPENYENYKEKVDWDRISYSECNTKKILLKFREQINWDLINWPYIIKESDVDMEFIENNLKEKCDVNYIKHIIN